MKSQREILKDEFDKVLKRDDLKELIIKNNLDLTIINSAFERLLDKNNGSDDKTIIEDGRSRFQTYIINTLQIKK